MTSVQWVQADTAASESVQKPATADRPGKPGAIRVEFVDIVSVVLVLAIVATAIVATIWAVQQYWWERAAYAAFKARHINDIVVPPLFDWPARERFVWEMIGSAGMLILELAGGVLLRRHARATARGARRQRQPRARRRATRITVRETFHEPAAEPESRRAAAERAAAVVWGDRVGRHEAASQGRPGGRSGAILVDLGNEAAD